MESKRLKKPKLKEHDRESLVLDWLNKNGIFAWKAKTMGTWDAEKGIYRKLGKFSLRGVSDILGVIEGGLFLAIEMKTPEGKLSIEQKAFLNKINRMGGKAFVARNISDVINNLNSKERKFYA